MPLLLAAAFAAVASTALAAPSRVMLGAAAILFDTAVWKATLSGNGTVTFTCIAADCPGQPRVFASTVTLRELATDIAAARRNARTIPDDGVPPLPFPAVAHPSGCRTPDEPVLYAGGQIGDAAYRFTTAIVAGCNFGAHLPESRFLDLIRGLEY